jgi:hypothetical protein
MIAAALAEQAVEDGVPGAYVPDDVLPVEVWPVAAPYQRAFSVLSARRRHSTTGMQALQYTEIVAYAKENGFAETITELEEFVTLIDAQDGAYLEGARSARGSK